jgi:hypothetical protein
MHLYAVEMKVCATAYIKANNRAEALDIARTLADESPNLLDHEGNIEFSSEQFDSPALPDVSLSPAMTIHGPWTRNRSIDLIERNIDAANDDDGN